MLYINGPCARRAAGMGGRLGGGLCLAAGREPGVPAAAALQWALRCAHSLLTPRLSCYHPPAFVQPDMSLAKNPGRWNRKYATLYIDQPIGTGFSRAGARRRRRTRRPPFVRVTSHTRAH